MALLVYILCFCDYALFMFTARTHTVVSLSWFSQCWVLVKEATGRGQFAGGRAGSPLTAWRRWLSAAWSPVQVRLLMYTHTHYTHFMCIKDIHATLGAVILIVPDVGVGQSDCHSFSVMLWCQTWRGRAAMMTINSLQYYWSVRETDCAISRWLNSPWFGPPRSVRAGNFKLDMYFSVML